MKKWLIVISIISFFTFSIFTIYSLTNVTPESSQNPSDSEQFLEPPMFVLKIPISNIFLIIAFIATFLYVIYCIFEFYLKKNLKIISNFIHKENFRNENNTSTINIHSIFLNLLNLNEKGIVKRLIEKDGIMLQSEISRMDTMNRVKAHRTVKDLERKGIVIIEQNGNTNLISLSEEAKKLLTP